jgi:hypothetical protein
MTVNYVEEIASGRRGTNDKGARSYSRAFRLNTTQQSEGPYAVGSHPSLPIIGSTHPEDSGAWCTTLTVENSDPWKGWTVTADYSTERELATDPTNDPAVITVHSEQFQKVAETDINGDSVCNSAGDPFDPPYMMDDSRRVISISKNMSGHPSWILSYADVVNSDSFVVKGVTYAVGVGKVQRVSIGETQTRNGVPFVVVTIEIHCQRDGWILRPLDAGFREKSGAGMINILNTIDFERPSAPVPLDGSGLAQAQPTSASAVYGAYTIYTTAAFSALPLT